MMQQPLLREGRMCGINAWRVDWPLNAFPSVESNFRAYGRMEKLCRSPAGFVIEWDGRLDNRKDLLHRFGPCEDSDATLALKVYEACQESGLGDIIGDWSAAIWDPLQRTIVLASDYVGTRPLYYSHTRKSLVWGSSLRDVLSLAGGPTIDIEYLTEYLHDGGSSVRTPFEGIRAVPPGHAVIVDEDRCRVIPIWQLKPGPSIRYLNEERYSEQFLELFEEAVKVRLQTPNSVYAELSGGLDSSAIISMAHRLISKGLVPARSLKTLTYVDEGSNDARYRGIMEQTFGFESRLINIKEFDFLSERPVGPVPQPWEQRNRTVADWMEADGADVFLTGQTGDLVMGNWRDDSEQVAEFMQQGSLLTAAKQAFAWSPICHRPVYSILWRALTLITGMKRGKPEVGGEDSLSPQLPRRKVAGNHDCSWKSGPATRKHVQAMRRVLKSRCLQTPEALRHVDYSHVYAHRPLVEFMMGIPPEILVGPGEPRRLMRRALEGLVPEQVLSRRSKASFNSVFAASMRPLAAQLRANPECLELERFGVIDRTNLDSRLQRYLSGRECNEGQLRFVILLEYWLRNWR